MEKTTIDAKLIKKISNEGDSQNEFIVAIDFEYCDVTYSGYQIVSRSDVKKLWNELQKDRQVYTPNMPGDWYEEYAISLLADAFSIHSDNPDDVKSMRNLFGDYVGNTELLDMVLDSEDESDEDDETGFVIDEEQAKALLKHPNDDVIMGATGITDEAARILSDYQGDELYFEAMEMSYFSDDVAESLAQFKGGLAFGEQLTELTDPAAESLSRHEGDLFLFGLTELSDAAAESLSKHKGNLDGLFGLTELSDAAAESLLKHEGKINGQDPKEWANSLRANKE